MDSSNKNTENINGEVKETSSEESMKALYGDYPRQPPEWTKNIVVSSTPWPAPDEKGNVSVKFNESEKEEPIPPEPDDKTDTEENTSREWPMWVQIGIIILMLLVTFLVAANVFKIRKSAGKADESVQTTQITSLSSQTVTQATSSDELTSSEEKEPTSVSQEEKTTAGSDENLNVSKDKEKIVDYFNRSSNRVKTEAESVVKKFENRTHNEDKLKLPSAIKGVAKSILESKFTDITEPEFYPSHEAVIAMYPVQGQEWSSKLTADDVAEATCVEKGGEDEITLVLNSCTDPEPGKGISKAVDCLDVPTVRDTAPPFVTAFSAEYYDCVIRCRVDKATGRVVWSSYTVPVVIRIGLDAGFVKFDAEIGLTFEKDYTVNYIRKACP